jgi:hypothetical protein
MLGKNESVVLYSGDGAMRSQPKSLSESRCSTVNTLLKSPFAAIDSASARIAFM